MLYYKYLRLESIRYFCEIDYVFKLEQWTTILGYDSLYMVSDLGRIKSLERTVLRSDNKLNFIKEKILKEKKSGKGYLAVCLCSPNSKKYSLVHRLVSFPFVTNAENKTDVNHKRGIKIDNRAIMLEWCTKSENSIHSFVNKLNIPPESLKGGKHPSSKKVIQYSINGEKINEYESTSIASIKTGIYQSGISRTAQGVLKQAGGFVWKYKNLENV